MPRTYAVESDTDNLTEEQIKEGLNHRGIKRYAYILHDNDVANPHWHVVINAPDNNAKITTIAKWFKVPENFVSVVRGRNGLIDMCEYLTHENEPEKHRYDDSEVKANFDWRKEVNLLQKERHRIKEQKKQEDKPNFDIDDIVVKISSGELKEYELVDMLPADIYIKYYESIEKALKIRAKKLSQKGDRNMKVYYLSGDSETYKTTFAKYVCEKHRWHYCISSASNDPLESYMGQEALILDDIRPSDHKFADLLKLLDSFTSSTIKSRYRNKVIECKAIFLTTVIPIEEFYGSLTKEYDEPRKQLMRRCMNYLVFEKDIIKQYKYDPILGEYVGDRIYENPCAKMHPKKAVTEEDFDIEADFLGLTNRVDDNGFIPTDEPTPFEGGFLKTPDGIQCSWLDGKE